MPAVGKNGLLLVRANGRVGFLVVVANNDYRLQFDRLRLSEMALHSASRQAAAMLTTSSSPVPTMLSDRIQRDMSAAREAQSLRRQAGLIFLYELDSLLESRVAADDRVLATQINVAFRHADEAEVNPSPFTPNEIEALRSDSMGSLGQHISSTQEQLRRARAILTPVRVVRGGDNLLEYDRMNRSVTRNYLKLGSPFRIYDDGWFDTFPENNFDARLRPLLIQLPGTRIGASSNSLLAGPSSYTNVLAINADAVTVLGTGPTWVRTRDLRPISREQIAEMATSRGPSNP